MPNSVIRARRQVSARIGIGIAVLSVLSAILLGATIWLFANLQERQERVAQSVREDALWAAFQTDREAAKLVEAALDEKTASAADIMLRFDLLYSRVSLLDSGKYAITFEGSSSIAADARAISDAVFALLPLMDSLVAEPTLLPEIRADILEQARTTQQASGRLMVSTNAATNAIRVAERDHALATYWQIGAAVAAFSLVLVLIVSLLASQLVHISRTGQEIERLSLQNAMEAERAQAANRAKSNFLATMSHEIRTPLNGIIGMTDVLEATHLSSEQSAHLDVIRQSGDMLLDVINDILDYSKLEAGVISVEPRVFAVPELMEAVRIVMEPRARHAGLAIRFDYPEVNLTADAPKLRQILVNFIGNAIKFTPSGTVAVTARLHDRRLVCSVRDTGSGITETDMARLFREFSQLDSSNTRAYGGTGLGLAICKRLAEALGGQVGVDSEPGLGSTFWVDIPVSVVSQSSENAAKSGAEPGFAITGKRALVVDDNPINRSVAGGLLARLGQEVAFAVNGEEALARLADAGFDYVLMDMQMPVLDGLEATRRARALGYTIPIIGLTANAFDTDRQACLDAGMDGFIAKPITREKLAGALRTTPVPHTSAPSPAPQVDRAYQADLIRELGEPEFRALVQQFCQDAQTLIAAAGQSDAAADIEALDQALHTLKGAALTLGFQDLAQSAQAMRTGGFDPEKLRSQLPHAA